MYAYSVASPPVGLQAGGATGTAVPPRVHSSAATTALDSSANACALVRFLDGVDGDLEGGAGLLSMSNRRLPFLLPFQQLKSSLACLHHKTTRGMEAQASRTRPVSTCM